jgi:hypothetical protein
MNQPQIGRPGNGIADGGDRMNAAARKNIAFDKIHLSLVSIEYLIPDGDGLQRHQAVIFQQPAASLKEGGVKMMADGLDHFDGNQFVKFAAKIAVVLL